MTGPVLFVRAGALGDFVLTLPVLHALLDAGLVVDVAVPGRFSVLLPPGIRRVWAVERSESAWLFSGERRDYASAVVFSPGLAAGLRAAGLKVYTVPPLPTEAAGRHYAKVLGEGRQVEEAPRLRIPLPPADPAGPVVIAPGSGGQSKRWPLKYWEALHHRLADLPVVWVAGPVEEEEQWPVEPLRLGLRETAELAARCRCWLGPDAGPSHLAAAAGARVGVVFRTTEPAIWAPVGAAVFQGATVEDVEGWVRTGPAAPEGCSPTTAPPRPPRGPNPTG